MKIHFYLILVILIFQACTNPGQKTESMETEAIAPIAETLEEEPKEEAATMELDSAEIEQDEPFTSERIIGSLKVNIEVQEVPEYIFHIMSIYNAQGEKVDELRIIKFHNSSTGCDSRISSEYSFTGDSQFQIISNNYKYDCGAEIDPSSGVSEEEFLRIENPYDIVVRESESQETTFYTITEIGKIVKGESTSILVSDKISSLERFDELPRERLRLLRNHIFAQYGYQFKSEDLANHFASKDWYSPRFDNVDKLLTENDKQIIAYLRDLEAR